LFVNYSKGKVGYRAALHFFGCVFAGVFFYSTRTLPSLILHTITYSLPVINLRREVFISRTGCWNPEIHKNRTKQISEFV